jgi:hypothetical protein
MLQKNQFFNLYIFINGRRKRSGRKRSERKRRRKKRSGRTITKNIDETIGRVHKLTINIPNHIKLRFIPDTDIRYPNVHMYQELSGRYTIEYTDATVIEIQNEFIPKLRQSPYPGLSLIFRTPGNRINRYPDRESTLQAGAPFVTGPNGISEGFNLFIAINDGKEFDDAATFFLHTIYDNIVPYVYNPGDQKGGKRKHRKSKHFRHTRRRTKKLKRRSAVKSH